MLQIPSMEDASSLRALFEDTGYTQDNIKNRLGLSELPSRRMRTIPRLLDRTREPHLLNTLLRWFIVGFPVESQAAREHVPEWALRLLLECGALRDCGDTLAPEIMITPFEHLLLASDPALEVESPEHADVVLWPNPTTRLLYRFTMRQPVGATLDFGGGCGVQALVAASHSRTVVATDLNARAASFTRWNARFNGISNVECLTGDFFAPVEGNTFDLILANPPFFVVPENRYLFCDNPMELDGFCRELARQAPRYLNEGGYLQMVCEWVQLEGGSWQDRIASWFEGTGCDVWILKGYGAPIANYAQDRMRETNLASDAADNETYAAWMDFYRARKVQAVHGGIVAMRRRDGANWMRLDELPAHMTEPFGDVILRGFDAQDFLQTQGATDEALLATRPALAPHVRLEQALQPGENGWTSAGMNLRLVKGIPFSVGVQPLVAEFVGYLNGSRSLEEVIGALAQKVNADRGQVERECLAVVRKLIERGFLNVA